MAKLELCGALEDEVDEMEEDFNDRPEAEWYEFEERFCLAPIQNQPPDYDGPVRFCKNRACWQAPNFNIWRCKKHKTVGTSPTPENLEEYANFKHGMYASYEALRENLTEKEKKVFDGILEWADVYGINKEEEPAAHEMLVILAHERVRSIKTAKYLGEKGEVVQKPKFTDDGSIIINEDGEKEMEDEANPIADGHRQLVKLVQSLMKDLVLTPKERMKADDRNKKAESADTTSEALSELVSDREDDFDMSNYDHEDDESQDTD